MSESTKSLIIIPVIPLGKPRMTQRDKWLNPPRKCVSKYWDYKDTVRKFWRDNPLPTISLELEFFIPMSKSWSQKKKELKVDTYHDQKPDIDNLLKAFMDALIPEDKKIACITASKFWVREDKGCIVVKNYE